MSKHNPKYRENSLDPKHIGLIIDLVDMGAANSFYFLLVDTEKLSRVEYVQWIDDWKFIYSSISLDIRLAKNEGRHQDVNMLKIMANTLINARQYARDRRRANKDVHLTEDTNIPLPIED